MLGGSIVLSCLRVQGWAKSASQLIPGWLYSFVAVLEPGATSWTGILDVVRLGPADDATAVTAARLRAVVERLVAAGRWQPGAPDITIVMDAGYDVTAWPGCAAGSSRRVGRPDPRRPGDAPAEAAPLRPQGRPPANARAGVPLHQARDVARTLREHGHRHHQLRQGRSPGVGPGPPGPPRNSVLPRRRIGGPGSWSSRTLSSGLPARRRPTSADPGRNRPNLHGSPRPGSAKNRRPAPRYDVGKPVNRPETLKAIGRPGR